MLYAGRIYYLQGDYAKAVPVFEYVAANGKKFTVKAYDEAWEKLLENGTLDELQKKYFGYNIYDLVPEGYKIGDEL